MTRKGKTIKYKKLHADARIDAPVYAGDVGYDIYSLDYYHIFPGERGIVRTGIALQIPTGYYASIDTRSSYGVNQGAQCHRGIIDTGYRGEITVAVYNQGERMLKVVKGDKVAQLIFHKIHKCSLEEVSSLENSERGVKGMGSTGR